MLTWFYYTIASAIGLTLFALIVRKLLKDKGDSVAFTFIVSVTSGIVLLVLSRFEAREYLFSLRNGILLIIITLLYSLVDLLFIKGRQLEEVGKVSIAAQIGAITSLFGAAVVLSEPLSWPKIFGVFIIIAGNVLAFYKGQRLVLSKGVKLVLIASILFSLGTFIDKILLRDFSPALYKGIDFMIASVWLLALMKFDYNRVIKEVRLQKGVVLIAGALFGFTLYLFAKALSMGEASRVTPIHGLNIIFTVLLGIVLLGERENILRKVIAAAVVFAGAWLLTL